MTPREFWDELDAIPKAILMDLCWDFATRCYGDESDTEGTIAELRAALKIVRSIHKTAPDTRPFSQKAPTP